jgi:hypothetical protein
VGGSIQLTATLQDAAGNVLSGRAVAWTSADEDVATVDSTGLVTGAGAGPVTVSARSEGQTGAASVRVVVLDPAVYEVTAVSGGGQSGFAGTVLSRPLVVLVSNRNTGSPKEGVAVGWRAGPGGGAPTRTTSTTVETGRAATRVELGNSAGNLTVTAEVFGLPAVTFQVMALPAPTLQSVSPGSVAPGDTVSVSVADLPDGSSVAVTFDGVAGSVVNETAGTPTVLDVIVPAAARVCGPTAEVDVRLRAGGITTAPVSLTVAVPADPFQVGQVLVIEGTQDVQCATLPAAGGAARYLLVPLSAEFESDGRFQVTLGADQVTITPVAGARDRGVPGFHDRLREHELGLAAHSSPVANVADPARLLAEPEVGSARQFRVLNTTELSGLLTEEDFDLVTATLMYKGAHTLLYIDDAAPSGGFTQGDADFLGELYDRYLYEANLDYFGAPSDRDRNDRVIVLLSPVVNGLSQHGTPGIIVGFFFGLDLFSPNASGCSECRFSNDGELLYGIVPDPDAIFTDTVSRERTLELLPGVMVHEMQHMISFRFKVLIHGNASLETLWLSEALAHASEEVAGDAAFFNRLFEISDHLYEPNFDRAWRYLSDPSQHSLTATSGGGTLERGGAGWLFLRWLADQYGDFIFRDMTQARANGVANVEQQTGETFFRLFADWAVALWADDLAIPGLARRYQIPKWPMRLLLRFGDPPEYTLQPLQRTFGELRSTDISVMMAGSSPLYVEVDASGDTNDLDLELSAPANAGLAILRIE